MSNLTPTIKSIQDVMRQDSGVDGDAQRISQLTWLLFLKVFDALEEELELTRDSYPPLQTKHVQALRLSRVRRITGRTSSLFSKKATTKSASYLQAAHNPI